MFSPTFDYDLNTDFFQFPTYVMFCFIRTQFVHNTKYNRGDIIEQNRLKRTKGVTGAKHIRLTERRPNSAGAQET